MVYMIRENLSSRLISGDIQNNNAPDCNVKYILDTLHPLKYANGAIDFLVAIAQSLGAPSADIERWHSMSKERFCPIVLSLTLLLIGQQLIAQSDRGTVTGTVVDAAAAVIPGAALTLINTGTGAVYTTVTTETGNYTVPSLPVGTYTLTAARQGFSKYVQEGIQVQVAVSLRIDVTLQVGSSVESVTVTASAPLLKTESADQSFNITGDQVNALPLTQGSAGLRNPMRLRN